MSATTPPPPPPPPPDTPDEKWRPGGRVLAVQSHVVRGYVGNKASTFPLQLMGLDVDPLNSVQFSNHGGYPTVKGESLSLKEFTAVTDGMRANGFFSSPTIEREGGGGGGGGGGGYTHVLSGYIRCPDVLEALAGIIQQLQSDCADVSYFCDPVLGDNGKLYVPEACVESYRRKLLPLAAVSTPNQFEIETLTGVTIETEQDAVRACNALHDMGPRTVVITSAKLKAHADIPPSPHGPPPPRQGEAGEAEGETVAVDAVAERPAGDDSPEKLCIFVSTTLPLGRRDQQEQSSASSFASSSASASAPAPSAAAPSAAPPPPPSSSSSSSSLSGARAAAAAAAAAAAEVPLAFRLEVPKLGCGFGGCGDLLAACLLGNMHTGMGVIEALEKAVASVQHVLRRSILDGSRELRLIQSKAFLERPIELFRARAVSPLGVCGVIFDMDGTLTMPGHIDFAGIRSKAGLAEGDIIAQIRALPPSEARRAMSIVEEGEMAALDRMELRPGLKQLMLFLYDRRIKCAICTRNMKRAVDHFLDHAGLPHDMFSDVITRDFDFVKPDKRIAQSLASKWGMPTANMLFVGDHEDDMVSGAEAGCSTVLIKTDRNAPLWENGDGAGEAPSSASTSSPPCSSSSSSPLVDWAIGDLLQLREIVLSKGK